MTQRSSGYGVRVIYTDLDGTMVGPSGCFFRAEDRSVTLEPARALAELLAAGIDLVLVSGRTQAQLLEACAIFGADGYVAELGAMVGWDRGRGRQLLRGAMPEQFDAIPDDLVQGMFGAFVRKIEFHDPWHIGHELDVMLRGDVDVAAVNAWFAAQGAGWVRLHDNGLLPPRPTPNLDLDLTTERLHVYHLVPDGIDKGRAVAFDLARRGLSAEQAIAIGDSASDLLMAPHVGRFHLVANGARHEHVRALAEATPNVVIEATTLGLGWACAVRSAVDHG